MWGSPGRSLWGAEQEVVVADEEVFVADEQIVVRMKRYAAGMRQLFS